MKTFYTTDAQNEDQAKDSLRADPHFIWNRDEEVRILIVIDQTVWFYMKSWGWIRGGRGMVKFMSIKEILSQRKDSNLLDIQ